jgi:hypothetical protein
MKGVGIIVQCIHFCRIQKARSGHATPAADPPLPEGAPPLPADDDDAPPLPPDALLSSVADPPPPPGLPRLPTTSPPCATSLIAMSIHPPAPRPYRSHQHPCILVCSQGPSNVDRAGGGGIQPSWALHVLQYFNACNNHVTSAGSVSTAKQQEPIHVPHEYMRKRGFRAA